MEKQTRHAVRRLLRHLLPTKAWGVPAQSGLGRHTRQGKPGFLWVSSFLGGTASPAVADAPDVDEPVERYDIHAKNGGPGQTVSCYLPKKAEFLDKLTATLSPSHASASMVPQVHSTKGKGKQRDMLRVLKIVEKRLDVNLWRIGGRTTKAAISPSCSTQRTPAGAAPTLARGAARSSSRGRQNGRHGEDKAISAVQAVDIGVTTTAVVGVRRKILVYITLCHGDVFAVCTTSIQRA